MLIFLDIDGVMVPANSWKRPEFLADGFAMFSHNAVQAMKKIIYKTKGDIVLTTSHKSRYTLEQWRNIFETRGIITNNIFRLPKNTELVSREEEILNWFNINSIEQNFVIIDDDKSLNNLPQYLKEKLVLTNGSIGLTDSLADQAIQCLSENHKLTHA